MTVIATPPAPLSGSVSAVSMAVRAGAWAICAAAWLAIVVVAIAPWLLGGMPPWASVWISAGGIAALAIWLGGLALLRQSPGVSAPCLLLVAAVLLLGWAMTWSPRATYFGPGRPFAAAATMGGFGTVDGRSSREAMLPITAATAVLVVAASISREPVWRRRVIAATVVSGAALAGYGLLERAGDLPGMIDRSPGSPLPFGPFRYHGVAGAYLNLVLPLAVCATVALFVAGRRRAASIAGLSAVICLVASFVNVSKAGMALAAALCLISLAACAVVLRNAGMRVSPKVTWASSLAVLICAAMTLIFAGGEGRRRWAEFVDAPSLLGGRRIMWRISAAMAADAGAFGYGPGTFKLLLPHTPHFDRELYRNWIVTEHVPGAEVSDWSYACNDYLQSLIEWGWLGAALWAGVIGGAIVIAFRVCRSDASALGDRLLLAGVLVSVGGLLAHAMIDGPMQVQSILVLLGAMLGLGWGSRSWISRDESSSCASC